MEDVNTLHITISLCLIVAVNAVEIICMITNTKLINFINFQASIELIKQFLLTLDTRFQTKAWRSAVRNAQEIPNVKLSSTGSKPQIRTTIACCLPP